MGYKRVIDLKIYFVLDQIITQCAVYKVVYLNGGLNFLNFFG